MTPCTDPPQSTTPSTAPEARPGPLDRLFDEAVRRGRLFEEGDGVLAAVSGGPDSVALLHLLQRRAQSWRLRIGVAHLDHGLRAEAGRDAAFVEGLAARGGLAFHHRRVDVAAFRRRHRTSLEEAGRRLRYAFFEETAAAHGYRRVALGHHADDQAETLLLNLLRGAGGRGLAGMPAVRGGRFVRPLLRATRADIDAYLQAHRLSWVADATNGDPALRRNRLRHHLIPTIERDYQPRVRSLLARAAEVLGAEEAWIEGLLDPVFERVIAASGQGRVALHAAALAALPPAAARRIVRRAIAQVRGDLRRIGFDHVERVLDLAGGGTGPGPLHLPGGTRAALRGAELRLFRDCADGRCAKRLEEARGFEYRMDGCGVLRVAEAGVALRLSIVDCDGPAGLSVGDGRTAYLAEEAVAFPLTVRSRRPGDRFHPLGARGGRKLKQFFIDRKVPRPERDRCPLLVSRGRILWVAGHRPDERARVGPGARRVVKAELLVA